MFRAFSQALPRLRVPCSRSFHVGTTLLREIMRKAKEEIGILATIICKFSKADFSCIN